MIQRRKTRKVTMGDRAHGFVSIGGDAPVALQTMTSTYTYDIDATVKQINALHAAGADLVRVAVPDKRDTEALKEVLNQVRVPIAADVHFHFERALESIAAGVHKIRLNPGNIQDRPKVEKVIAACKERGIPIRVGANEGGIVERKDKGARAEEMAALEQDYRGQMTKIMCDKLEEYLRIFADNDFYDVVLSAKSVDPQIVLQAYRETSRRFDFPLHLGVTHAGPPETGRIRSVAALSGLLADGIGDTIRISYASDPIDEVIDGKELLQVLGLRLRTEPELIACPTCGRIEIDLIAMMAEVRKRMADIAVPVKIAVMGCVVNGPGEAEGSDVAVFAGKHKGVIYVQGEQVATVSEDKILDALFDEVRKFAAKVERGEATLKNAKVNIKPPDPIGELGSGWGKVRNDRLALPVMRG
ncbi:MAG TPA: flavodoxin-dependent (E)-4-hydroxy-3-methylbut-2-enyl-diphosphate synthase [Tepidisphaeraceae bacterium]|jgi:(E)-4-hydroxy-3-methylbut-2-enyl-diphosphate synthase|nr:flavodoxin-dependent (E)-4-hydroxy-3-methylbut-2-enyl-diphosphate synthase [Tepidisphaeraceae bacterium]